MDVPPGEPRPATDVDSALTTFQIEVAQMFFALSASEGFLLAGGAALAAQHLTSRTTQDLVQPYVKGWVDNTRDMHRTRWLWIEGRPQER